MDAPAKLRVLLELAESCGIGIRRAPLLGDRDEQTGGALIRLKGREILFLDPSAPPAEQIGVVAAALVDRREIQDRFLPPEIRQVIEAAEKQENRKQNQIDGSASKTF